MNMTNDLDHLIDRLAADATPVRVQRDSRGRLMLALIAGAIFAFVATTLGVRPDLLNQSAENERYLALGLLSILALASGYHAIRVARPQVGAPAPGLGWLVAALAILPILALATILAEPRRIGEMAVAPGLRCLEFGLICGTATLAYLAFWLRRGATVRPHQAAWLAGLCGGAVGAIGVTLECGEPSLLHLDIWHVAVVPAMAIFARFVLPPLLRWR